MTVASMRFARHMVLKATAFHALARMHLRAVRQRMLRQLARRELVLVWIVVQVQHAQTEHPTRTVMCAAVTMRIMKTKPGMARDSLVLNVRAI